MFEGSSTFGCKRCVLFLREVTSCVAPVARLIVKVFAAAFIYAAVVRGAQVKSGWMTGGRDSWQGRVGRSFF